MKIYSELQELIKNEKVEEIKEILKNHKNIKEDEIDYLMIKCENESIKKILEEYKTIKKRKIDTDNKKSTENDANNSKIIEDNNKIDKLEDIDDKKTKNACEDGHSKSDTIGDNNKNDTAEDNNKNNAVENDYNTRDITENNKNTEDDDDNKNSAVKEDEQKNDTIEEDHKSKCNVENYNNSKDNHKKDTLEDNKNAIEIYKYQNDEYNKIQKAIYEAMINNLKDFEYKRCAVIAHNITQIIIGKQKINDKTFIRTKIFNLRDKQNPLLCKNVYDGKIKPEEYLDMTNEEMKSDELKTKDKDIIKNSLFDSQVPKIEAETDMFKCGKCKKNKTTYYQLQTRSADEPMTTFVRCVECNNRWKF
ncbi:hypothetical protein BDAP_002761 [Binucleata daphniae]